MSSEARDGDMVRRFCNRCGQPVAADDFFCPHCGNKLPDFPPLPDDAADEASEAPQADETATGDDGSLAPSSFDPAETDGAASALFGPSERLTLERVGTGETIELSLPCVLGRGSLATCQIAGNDAVSREHARLYEQDGVYLVRDLGSINHTYVDGVGLEADDEAELHDGSVLTLADERLVFHVEGQA